MKRIFPAVVVLCLSVCVLSSVVQAAGLRGGRIPGPTLVTPGDDEDITGREIVEFRWSPEGDRSSFSYYDFKLYKGHETIEAGLILKKQVPSGETSTRVESSLFEDGQTYAWSVRQAGGVKKGQTSFAVFKVIKRS